MSRPQFEVADVIRQCGAHFQQAYGSSQSYRQLRVLQDIVDCRTAAFGGHAQKCDTCGRREIAYNSCRNRHCPKCQAAGRAEWMAAREQELLRVPYFHAVFTLPHELGPLALQNRKVIYGLLFRAAAQTLLQVAADPRHLGAKIGFLAVLHTWGQNLMHHPHLHVVIPGGGLSLDGTKWIACRRSRRGKDFFLPVRVLSQVFRGKFIAGLKHAFDDDRLEFHGQLQNLSERGSFEHLLDQASRKNWVVYAKRPFGGPQQVLKYLARYTHRVAISNRRLLRLENGRVTFRYKDYADAHQQKTMTLDGSEFLRRFLLHVLPRGFVRIRHYGLLSNRNRKDRLNRCRELLDSDDTSVEDFVIPNDSAREIDSPDEDGTPVIPCPECPAGRLITIELVPATARTAIRRPHFLSNRPSRSSFADTS